MKTVFCFFLTFLLFVNCNSQNTEINSITTLELKDLLKKDIQLLDVRTPEEVKNGAIEKALFVNYFDKDFTEKAVNKLDKNKPVYLYCRSGNRSGKAAILLKNKWFKVVNVIGGYSQWIKEH